MISKAATIVLYAERFAKLAGVEDEDSFSHDQCVRQVEDLVRYINAGKFKAAVRFFNLLREEGSFEEGNGKELLPRLVDREKLEKFIQWHDSTNIKPYGTQAYVLDEPAINAE